MEMNFEKEFMRINPAYPHLLRFMQTSLQKSEISWKDITKLNMERVCSFLTERVSPNSARTYIAVIKAFLARYSEENLMPCVNPQMRVKAVPSQHIALSYEEVMKLDAYQPKNDTERDVKNIFMRGCLTGARYSDAIAIDAGNISNGVLTYVSKKTHTEVKQPAHALLWKYIYEPPTKIRHSVVVNRTIKQICQNIGMVEEVQLFVNGKLKKGHKYEFVTEHTSRRTYCTILAEMNVPTEVISKLAGHSNSNITSNRYICIDTKRVGEAAMRFFEAK